MSSVLSATPLALEIKSSRLLAVYVLCVYATASLLVVAMPVPFWIKCCALLTLLLFCTHTYQRRVNLVSRHAIIGLQRHTNGCWQLRRSDGALQQATLLPDSYLHPELLVLNFRIDTGRRCSVVLARDSADATQLRRMRVGLALGCALPPNDSS